MGMSLKAHIHETDIVTFNSTGTDVVLPATPLKKYYFSTLIIESDTDSLLTIKNADTTLIFQAKLKGGYPLFVDLKKEVFSKENVAVTINLVSGVGSIFGVAILK